MTPHIAAKKEDIAKVVLMPGDPLRAKFIAENFLENYRIVSNVRNMLFFTGTYKGTEITVAGSGMGCPSIGIYSYELYKFYDVDTIIRVGSAGSYQKDVKVYDLVNATSAYGESSYAKIAANIEEKVIKAPGKAFDAINQSAEKLGIKLHNGVIHSSDVFYRYDENDWKEISATYQTLCVEMEAFALFANAQLLNKNAATLLTISDSFITHERTTAEERETNFKSMMAVALEAAVLLNE